jgi:methylmalonyl-CoA/ethylmalonyl-CoA epimerase
MGIEGLIKIGIATKDLDKTASALADAFGLELGEAVAYGPFGMRYRILTLGGLYIEVIEPTGTDGPIAKFIEEHGEGLQHITFKVSDIEQVMADMKSKGARFTASAPVKVNSAIGPVEFAFMSPRGTNGVLIQLMEGLPD